MNDSSVWFPSSSLEVITVVDHQNYCLAWRYISLPRWLLSAVRWQTLTVEGGKTRYESVEAFNGLLVYVLKYLIRGGLQRGFEAMGQALKDRSEPDW
jgi:hypothetical protein